MLKTSSADILKKQNLEAESLQNCVIFVSDPIMTIHDKYSH